MPIASWGKNELSLHNGSICRVGDLASESIAKGAESLPLVQGASQSKDRSGPSSEGLPAENTILKRGITELTRDKLILKKAAAVTW